jgi:hypothetical protein
VSILEVVGDTMGDGVNIEDGVEIIERLTSLDHGDDQDFVIGGLLVLAGGTIRPGAEWAAAPRALRWVTAGGD